MKTRILILFNLFLFNLLASAQPVKWERVYGSTGYDNAYSVVQTYDKGYVAVGSTTSFGSGSTDAYLLKVDSMGVAQLQRMYGGINIDQAYSVATTNDSGLVIAGITNSYGHGGYDMYVIKTDKYGDTMWTKTYGGSNWDFGYSIHQTADSGYILAGGTYSVGNGNEDMYLLKLNAAGDTVWTKTFGGANDDEAKSVKQTSDGGYILTGYSKSLGDPNGDVYTIKTNASGDTTWTYRYAGAQEDYSTDVIERSSGNFVVVGKTNSAGTLPGFNTLSIYLNSSGNQLAVYSDGGTQDDGFNSVIESNNGTLGMAGYTYSYGYGLGTSDYWLFALSPLTGPHYPTMGGSKNEVPYCINKTSDGGFIICGISNSYSILDHIYLVKTDSDGVAGGGVTTVLTGINSVTSKDGTVRMYPNPANDKVYLDLSDKTEKITSISFLDVVGKEYNVELLEKSNEQLEFSTQNLANGIYFIRIEKEHSLTTEKIIIQH